MTDLMKDLEDLELYALSKLNEAAQESSGTRLPFFSLYAHIINGNPQLKESKCAARYFGGFSTDADKMAEAVENGDIPAYPAGWVSYTGASGEKEFPAMGTRAITVAVIKGRQSWLDKDGKSRAPDYDAQHSRRHLQYLCAYANAGSFFSPIVLTAKGHQVDRLIKSVEAWERAIAPHRKALNATKLPRSAFWFTIGTSGEKPVFEEVGKTTTHMITPVTAIVPPEMKTADVAGRFVGKDNVRLFAEFYEKAQEWLTAWKAPEQVQNYEPEPPQVEEPF